MSSAKHLRNAHVVNVLPQDADITKVLKQGEEHLRAPLDRGLRCIYAKLKDDPNMRVNTAEVHLRDALNRDSQHKQHTSSTVEKFYQLLGTYVDQRETATTRRHEENCTYSGHRPARQGDRPRGKRKK